MASANTQSANEPSPQGPHFLVHMVQLNPTIKAQISGRMASISLGYVVTTSVYTEKTHLKKFMNE